MWVKICANTTLEDTRLAVDAGADAVGFVFAPSKRQVTAEQVAEITKELRGDVETVGVFTSTDAEEIVAIACAAGISAVQIHSSFNPSLVSFVKKLSGERLKIYQVMDIADDTRMIDLERTLLQILQEPAVDAVLLDASHHGTSGGTGQVFGWDKVAGTVRHIAKEAGGRVIVAGGLRPANVEEAIAVFKPWGVDVASGAEQSPGRKSPELVRAFIRLAKRDPKA